MFVLVCVCVCLYHPPYPPPPQKVADGIIAPGYDPAALEILKAKKGGKFIVLQAKADYEAPAGEYREVYGVGFYQDRNAVLFGTDNLKVFPQKVSEFDWFGVWGGWKRKG